MERTDDKRFLVWAIIASHFAPPFMASGVAVALPAVGVDLNAGASSLGLVETLFLSAQVAFLLPAGRLAGASSKETLFKLGLAGFAVTTLLIAMLSSMPIVLVLRFVQGFFSAIFSATGPAILADIVPENRRGKAYGAAIGAVYAGLMLGPVVAGFLTDLWGWRAVFLVGGMLPLGMFAMVRVMLPSSWRVPPPGAVHVPSALLLLATALCLVAGASTLREGPLGYAYLAGGAVLAAVFVLLQRRLTQPLLNIRLLMQNRVLARALFVQVVLYLNGFCAVFLLAIYIQVSLGHAANVAGEVLAIGTILMTVLAPIAGRLADRYRPGLILTFGVGMVLMSAAMGVTLSGNTSLPFVVLLLVVHGIGWALFSSPNMTVIMNSVPPDGRSIASALGATARTLGMLSGMLVTALLISLGLGNEPVDRHPVEFVAIMNQAFWFLTVVTAGLLVVCIRDARTRRSGA